MSAEPDVHAPHPPIAVDPVLGRHLATIATVLRGSLDQAAAQATVLATSLSDITVPDDCDCPALSWDLEELRKVLRIIQVPLACFLEGLPVPTPPTTPITEAQT